MLTLKAWRDMLAHKGQFIALIVLVALGIMSFVTFQNGYYDLQASLDHAYTTLRFADFTVRVERMPLTAARAVERIPGVAAARVRTVSDVGLELENGDQATARVISSAGTGSEAERRPHRGGPIPRGRRPRRGPAGTQFATDTNDAARRPAHAAHRRTSARDVRVVGIASDPEYLYAMQSEGTLPAPGTFAIVYTTEDGIEHLFGTSHSGNDIAVKAAARRRSRRARRGGRGRAQALRPGLDRAARRHAQLRGAGVRARAEPAHGPLAARAGARHQLDVAVHRAVAARPGPARRDRARQGARLQRRPDPRPLPDHRDDRRCRRVGPRRRAWACGARRASRRVRVDPRPARSSTSGFYPHVPPIAVGTGGGRRALPQLPCPRGGRRGWLRRSRCTPIPT